MANQLLSIQEAADLVNKSVQTIRRLIKGGKIKYRRKKTAQGFNYQIDKASLLEEYGSEQPVSSVPQPEETPQPTHQAPEREPQPIREQQYEPPVYKVETQPQIYILDSQQEDSQPVTTPSQDQTEPASQPAYSMDNSLVEKMLDQHREDKEKLYQLLEIFQNRVVSLEEQVKQLQAPKRSWWKFW